MAPWAHMCSWWLSRAKPEYGIKSTGNFRNVDRPGSAANKRSKENKGGDFRWKPASLIKLNGMTFMECGFVLYLY